MCIEKTFVNFNKLFITLSFKPSRFKFSISPLKPLKSKFNSNFCSSTSGFKLDKLKSFAIILDPSSTYDKTLPLIFNIAKAIPTPLLLFSSDLSKAHERIAYFDFSRALIEIFLALIVEFESIFATVWSFDSR